MNGDAKADAKTGWIVLAVATIAHAVVALSLPLVPSNDSIWYLAYTHALSSQALFDPYAPGAAQGFDIVAPIGYSLLLDVGVWLFGWARLGSALVLFQHALGIASAWLVWRIGVLAARPHVGLAAAVLYALFLPAAIYCQLVLSEPLFIFLVLLATALFLRWQQSGSERWLVGAATALGLACTVRYPSLLCVAVLAGAAWLGAGTRRERGRAVAVLALPAVLLLGATIVHNGLWFGRYAFTDAGGRHLSNRLWAFEGRLEAGEPHTERILELCRASGIDFTAPSVWWEYHRALRASGELSAPEADRLTRDMAVATILADPLGFVARTPLALAALLVIHDDWAPEVDVLLDPARYGDWIRGWSRSPADAETIYIPPAVFEARRALIERLRIAPAERTPALAPVVRAWDTLPQWDGALAWVLVFAWLVLAVGGNARERLMAALVLALLLPGAVGEYPFPRYRQPVIPFFFLLLVDTLAFGWHILRPAPSGKT